MTLAGKIRAYTMREKLAERISVYSHTPPDIPSIQLGLLNANWTGIVRSVPYWKRMYEDKRVPKEFFSLDEYAHAISPTSRSMVQQRMAEMMSAESPAQWYRISGGSTAEPIRIPAWKSEVEHTLFDMWTARSWYGIEPDARIFLLWGHSHLLGKGIKGWINGRKRVLNDYLLGYMRFSAYDLCQENMKEAGRELLRFRPDCIIGYSVALDLFAQANEHLSGAFSSLCLKAAVGAAENFPFANSRARLQSVLSCPVSMEYGSIETGLIAHYHPDGYYKVFWKSYLVEAVPSTVLPNAFRILVTSLYPRCFPLIRYELGDEIDYSNNHSPNKQGSIIFFQNVLGRCNGYVVLPGGALIHSLVFSIAIKSTSEIRAYQVIQEGDEIKLNYLSDTVIGKGAEAEIRSFLQAVNGELASVNIRRVESLERTIAGKTSLLIRR